VIDKRLIEMKIAVEGEVFSMKVV